MFFFPAAVANIIFQTRMGCLLPDLPERVPRFISAINDMMASSVDIMLWEDIHMKLNTKFWRRHKQAWDTIFEVGKQKDKPDDEKNSN